MNSGPLPLVYARDFTSGEVGPEKISRHGHVCTGRRTQTGATLTVFCLSEAPGDEVPLTTIFEFIQYIL